MFFLVTSMMDFLELLWKDFFGLVGFSSGTLAISKSRYAVLMGALRTPREVNLVTPENLKCGTIY